MSAPQVSAATRSKVARSVLTQNLRLRPGERIIVEAWTHTLPWAVTFAREARRMGAYPIVPYEDEDAFWDLVGDGKLDVLGAKARHEWAALAQTNAYVHFWGPGDRVRLDRMPSEARDRLFAFNMGWYEAARKAGLRGTRMEVGRPYSTLARAYGVDLGKWTDQLVQATLVDPNDLQHAARPIVRALERGRRLRIRSPRGTDLTLGLAHRPATASIGRPKVGDPRRPFDFLTSLPAGLVRVALDESVAEGTIVANRDCYYDSGRAAGGVFRFRSGKLVSAEFDRGQPFFDRPYRTGGKGRDRPGLLGIGLNPKLKDTPQVEDLERGAVMVSVGTNTFFGGKNASSFFGFAIDAGATIEIDGRTIPL